jgi:16S rRNA (cytidine1402-2'-O)-methyltransferase
VVATPIGNLKDISERAKNTLSLVDIVLCEDTRVTQILLNQYKIKAEVMSYHQHSKKSKTQKIIRLFEEGSDIAMVTDAGTPSISDPGGKLIEELILHFKDDITIVPIPGPSALITALSVSGFPADEFVFLGFPPHKKGRQKFFNKVCDIESTVVFYESTHRIFKTLDELEQRTENRLLVVGRELTKLHETIYRGTVSDVTEELKSTSIKGEFVIVLAPKKYER